jgi:translocation and assembly module TamB
MRRAIKMSAWIVGSAAVLALLLIVAVLVAGNTAAGRSAIERMTYRLTAGHVKLSGLGGSFPADLTLEKLELIDRDGVWLWADQIALRWSPMALLHRRIAADSLNIALLDMERTPVSEPSSGGPVSIPHIYIAQFSIAQLKLGAPLAGRPASLSVRGSGRLLSLEDASADVVAHRTDNEGEYTLHFRFDPARMDGTLAVHEPASGPLENILQVPGLGALSANLSINGPRTAERIELSASAGDATARAEGSLDLRSGSADLSYSLEAPAVSPRADLRWQHVTLEGRWHGTFTNPTADGHLQIAQLQLPGGFEIPALRADLAASGGKIGLQGVLEGLRIPGSAPTLFARDPLKIEASMRVSEAGRPLDATASHKLFSLKAQAITAGRQSAALELRLPDVMPFAALAGQDVRGGASVKAQIEQRTSDIALSLDADAAISGGNAGWIAMSGNHLTLKLGGALSDDAFSIERLQLAGRAWALSASASATRPGAPADSSPARAGLDNYIKDLKARWDLRVSDLGIVASELAGELQASGALTGKPTALALDANLKSTLSIRGSTPGPVVAEIHARGLPAAPSAAVKVQGTVDGSPLQLEAVLERRGGSGLRADIQHADWKSAHLEGDWTMQASLADSRGQLRLQVAELGDLDHLLGTNMQGSLDGNATFTPQAGRTRAEFELEGRGLVQGPFSGTLHVKGEGDTDSVAAQLEVQSPNFEGAAANLSANAVVNLAAQELHLASASMNYRGQQLRLLSPAKFSYASGFKIDELKLGMQDAVLQIGGALSPNLDMRASLTHVDPKLINAFVPDLVSGGTIEGRVRLRGSLAAPTGRIRLAAHGVRFASDQAMGLPALDLNAGAELAGDNATVEVRLNAGTTPLLTVTGTAPLNAAGVYDLKIAGKLDLGLANPVFEARGMHEEGQVTVDATLGGTQTAPQIRGTLILANGNVRDYARGLNLTNVSAEIFGDQGTLQIKSFKATAVSGTFAMTGSVGVLQPGIPVDVKITASNAQPITSNIVTANLNVDIHISGTARERLAVGGTIRVNKAVIGIPDSLPPNVAVLDVRRRGKAAPPAAGKALVIPLDVTLHAPRSILVQGRGLDAELGGDVHIGGTTDAPLVSGGFELQRGSFTIASTRLTLTPPGSVSFDGAGLKKSSLDPTLDFTATSAVSNDTAYLHISGYADSPKFDFSSSAGRSPDEIMAMLLFGENASQLSALQAAQVGAALATLSGVGGGGANPITRLQKSLGLDRLSVGSNTTTSATGVTENSGAAIQAGRYISKRVYVEGKQSSTGQSQVEVDVDLTKHLKLQTRLGNGTAIQGTTPENDPGSSVGLIYQFEY